MIKYKDLKPGWYWVRYHQNLDVIRLWQCSDELYVWGRPYHGGTGDCKFDEKLVSCFHDYDFIKRIGPPSINEQELPDSSNNSQD